VSTWYCCAKNRFEDREVASPYRVSCWLFLNLKVQINDLNSITNRFSDRDSGAFLAGSWGFALFCRAISGDCSFPLASESWFCECSAGSVSSIERDAGAQISLGFIKIIEREYIDRTVRKIPKYDSKS